MDDSDGAVKKIADAYREALGRKLPATWRKRIREQVASGDGDVLREVTAKKIRQAKAAKGQMRWGFGTLLWYLEESAGDKPDGREIVDRETLTCEQCNLTIEVLKHADGKPSRTGPEPCEHLMEKGRDWFNARK